MGNGADRLINRALTGEFDGEAAKNLFLRARKMFQDFYSQHLCEESSVYPGVIDGLVALRNQSCILACVTNKPRCFAPELMRALNLDHYFEVLICGDDLLVKKPDPLPLLKVLEKVRLRPSQAVMVGDSASDMEAAKAANMKSFCLRYGYHQGKGVDALGADYIIDSVTEIADYIQQAA